MYGGIFGYTSKKGEQFPLTLALGWIQTSVSIPVVLKSSSSEDTNKIMSYALI